MRMTASRSPFTDIVRRLTVVLVIIGGFLAVPVLCDTGVAEHGCICDTTDCCVEEVLCELDPCGDVYKTEEWRDGDSGIGIVARLPLEGIDDATVVLATNAPTRQHPFRNQPYPDSDLPLLI